MCRKSVFGSHNRPSSGKSVSHKGLEEVWTKQNLERNIFGITLSHLHEHKFKYNFQNYLNILCSCGSSFDSTSHFLLHCPIFQDTRQTLLSTLSNINCKILEITNSYLTQTLLFGCTLLDPWPRPEGSNKIGSVRSSVLQSLLPSVHKFSRDWLISFFWNLAWCQGHIYICVWQSQIFWKRSPSCKNDQKWVQNMVFGLFKKITSLVFSGICVKWTFLWFINILRKLHAWEKSGFQVIAKNGSQPMRFQYSLIANISLID